MNVNVVVLITLAFCCIPTIIASIEPSQSILGNYSQAAVVTNGPYCADIGKDILLKNGSAVEATIAAMFCDGLVNLDSMGIGGGFLMTIYNREKREVVVLNARETAPAAATEDMFHGNANLSETGALSVAVPGELKGYWEAFQRFGSGNLEWRDLIEPSIELCRNGVEVTDYLGSIIKLKEAEILASESIREILVNPDTGELLKAGELVKRPKLAETLEKIAESNSVDLFYDGEIGEKFIEDLQAFGGIITMDDLRNYSVRWEEPTKAVLPDNLTLYSVYPPGSGALLTFILNILNTSVPADSTVTTYQRMTEAFEFAYGRRTDLGDRYFVDIEDLLQNLTSPDYAAFIRSEITDDETFQDPAHYGSVLYQPEDHGTAHLTVLAPNGDAVSVTSTINIYFGALLRSTQTGIIMNNEMDDFSSPNITNEYGVPPSPNNYIVPGKRPLSSMSPSIFIDSDDNVRLVIGAAGSTKITTGVAQTSLYNLYFNMSIKEALDARRIHHQLYPMAVQYEEGFPSTIVEGLEKIGHVAEEFAVGGSLVTAIAVQEGCVYANSDFRRNGTTAGF